MFDFLSEVQRCFGTIVSKFNLKIASVDDSECLLISSGFGLSIAYDRDGIDVTYIEQTQTGWQSYRLTNFLSFHRFTQEDRSLYGSPVVGTDRILASMRVFAAGLENRCVDILSGDKTWLIALKKRDAGLWSGLPVLPKVEALLASASASTIESRGAHLPPTGSDVPPELSSE